MDTFFEQIISIKKSPSQILGIIGLWVLTVVVVGLLFLTGILGSLFPIAVVGIGYGAFKLTVRFNVEYEYIVTNGILDIDKITNKSSRKRYLSLTLAKTSRIEKFNPALLSNVNKKNITIACNTVDQNAYLLVVDKEGGGADYLVISPNEKMQSAIAKCVPKFISNSAFK